MLLRTRARAAGITFIGRKQQGFIRPALLGALLVAVGLCIIFLFIQGSALAGSPRMHGSSAVGWLSSFLRLAWLRGKHAQSDPELWAAYHRCPEGSPLQFNDVLISSAKATMDEVISGSHGDSLCLVGIIDGHAIAYHRQGKLQGRCTGIADILHSLSKVVDSFPEFLLAVNLLDEDHPLVTMNSRDLAASKSTQSKAQVAPSEQIFSKRIRSCARPFSLDGSNQKAAAIAQFTTLPFKHQDFFPDLYCQTQNPGFLLPPRGLVSVSGPAKAMQLVDVSNSKHWSQKLPSAVFRGSSTGYVTASRNDTYLDMFRRLARTRIIEYANSQDSDGHTWLDAKFTSIVQFEGGEKQIMDFCSKNRMLGNRLSLVEQAERYQAALVIDGNTNADRFALQLGQGLVFKVESEENRSAFQESWEHLLIPGKHYIQVEEDPKRLVRKVGSVLEDVRSSNAVVKNAQAFVLKHLSPISLACHMLRLGQLISQHQVSDLTSEQLSILKTSMYSSTTNTELDAYMTTIPW